jgi:GNAT superfamily N-acetyltransferase
VGRSKLAAVTSAPELISVVPANEASWDDLDTVFGTRGDPPRCRCQYFKFRGPEWRSVPIEERAARLRDEAACDDLDSPTTSGLVAYLGGEPAGWCAVEPRVNYVRLMNSRIPWTGRTEDKTDDGVWAITCFVTRSGFRRRGVSAALTAAAVDFARERGARALEGYPMIVRPGQEMTWGELFVGNVSSFVDAGFTEVSRPTVRRAVMRIDFR